MSQQLDTLECFYTGVLLVAAGVALGAVATATYYFYLAHA